MNDEKRVNQNEVPKTIRARAFDPDRYIDLTQYTSLTFRMTGPATIEGAATGDADGYLEYTFTGTELAVPGTYQAQFHGVGPDGEPQTFPETTKLRVIIERAL